MTAACFWQLHLRRRPLHSQEADTAVGTAVVEVSSAAHFTGGGFAGGGYRGGGFRQGGFGPAIAAGIIAGSVVGAASGYYSGYGPGYYDNSYAYDNGYDGGYDNGYAVRNGFVCQPGTVFRGEDGRRYLCQ
jgi:hypothetical protein